MTDRYSDKEGDLRVQAINSEEQIRQRDQYRGEIAEEPERNTGLPGFWNPAVEQHPEPKLWHKSSQDPGMLQKDDQFLDDDNNIRKDADVNLDQR